jgi:hypothetical protein
MAGPGSRSTFQGYRAILPTSLTYIDNCSIRDSKPWRPVEVYGTTLIQYAVGRGISRLAKGFSSTLWFHSVTEQKHTMSLREE